MTSQLQRFCQDMKMCAKLQSEEICCNGLQMYRHRDDFFCHSFELALEIAYSIVFSSKFKIEDTADCKQFSLNSRPKPTTFSSDFHPCLHGNYSEHYLFFSDRFQPNLVFAMTVRKEGNETGIHKESCPISSYRSWRVEWDIKSKLCVARGRRDLGVGNYYSELNS